jgi:hypothetical protein
MNIHQISVIYHQEQDRLLARISSHESEELRLWLTRRLVLALVPPLTKTAADQLALQTGNIDPAAPQDVQRQRMLENFNKEALAHAGDFKTPYQARDAALPMGKEPLLVTEVKMALLKSGKVQLDFIEKQPEPGRNVRIAISAQLTQGCCTCWTRASRNPNGSNYRPIPVVARRPTRPSRRTPGKSPAT